MSTETVKKAKAPAKPRKATTTTKTAATETKAKTAKAKTAPLAVYMPTHEEIALLAQKYWAERGWQDGAAEQDWLRAEQELLGKAS
jgi:hypothetical protein